MIRAARRRDDWPYKMADLCRLTGMPRQAIHFYIHEGLVPPGRKTGRNTARYGEVHVERIRIVRQLQSERFMPLKAIRAVLDGQDDAFTPAQRGVHRRRQAQALVDPGEAARRAPAGRRPRAPRAQRPRAAPISTTSCDPASSQVERGPRGTCASRRTTPGPSRCSATSAAPASRTTSASTTELLRVYERAVAALVEREWRAVTGRLAGLPPDRVAAMLEEAMPLVHEFFARYHAKKVRDFFATMAG